MKICPNCGAENDAQAKFCEQCGHQFASDTAQNQQAPQQSAQNSFSRGNQAPMRARKNNKLPYIIAGVVVAIALVGGGVFFATRGTNNQQATPASTAASTSTVASSTSESTTASTTDISKYDVVIKEAKELTISGDYQASALKLASIPVSDLAKTDFAAIREAVEELTKQNETGMENAESNTASQNNSQDAASAGFTGENAKWANTYVFYYNQGDQIQSTLRIGANGGVTQTNYDGTQFFGQATLTGASGDILSYNTDVNYPVDQPDTKLINPNVQIKVTWEPSGNVQTYYGYLSYSSRLVLTDGASRGSGVNEVWITY